jgi:tRNA (guanine37-N1)-methyltransferase
MRFDILTVIPEAVTPYLSASILGRAAAEGVIECHAVDLRPFGSGKHRQLDDSPYGGGSGMVMKPGPLVAAIESASAHTPAGGRRLILLTSPAGRAFSRSWAHELAEQVDHLILVCGRYEGVDARVEEYVDGLISVGDYVLTGGEPAAMVIVDAVARLIPGALGNRDSTREESFEPNADGAILLEYPHYTRPREFRGARVPEVLLSGDHARIAAWRQDRSLARTRLTRPDLLKPLDQHRQEE